MVKFFAIVRPYPTYGLVVLLAVTVLGLWTTRADPRELDSALGMVLMVQMFLVSSGFAATARRGHYDPVLVARGNRATLLVVHWCASMAPGAAAWAILCACGYAWSSPAAMSAIAGERLCAFLIVSAIPWAAGFRLPRGAAGSLWMGVLIVLLLRHVSLLAPVTADSSLAVLRAAGAVLVCPFLLIGAHTSIGLPPLSAAMLAAAVLMLATIRQGSRLDVFLVERT